MINQRYVRTAWIMGMACVLACSALDVRAEEKEKTDKKQPDTVVPANRDGKAHQAINARAKKGNVALLFIGDSITAGWAGAGKAVWKKQYDPRHAMNAGIGGDRTQHILWRLDHGNIDGLSPKLAVLMIGTNNFGSNSAEDIALGIRAIVAKLRTKLPQTKVLVLGVFPRGEKPADPLRTKNLAVNALIKDIGDGSMISYLEINDKLINADGTQNRENMPDLVHLSPKGYQIWADAIEAKLVELLGEKK